MTWQSRASIAVVALSLACAWSGCTYDFTVGEGGGDSSVAGDGGRPDVPSSERRELTCRNTCACSEGESCELNCSGANACVPTCSAGSDCVVNCAAGACQIGCAANATCTINCSAGVCSTDCQGKCTINCGAGYCTCDGPGCP
ncbi:MAG: hypothetical protein KF850_02150 [Labilithrix sp.]|nr:hypothetical protein [Labilithrix sp.]